LTASLGAFAIMILVLLIEDHDDTREMFSVALQLQGFSVLTADSGEQALEILGSETPDVIVTDISMPDMNGVMLCRRIRSMPHLRTVPVIAVTGLSSETALAEVSAAGACALCPKPLSGDGLGLAVRSLLAERSSCIGCWQTGAGFRSVRFGDKLSGWMRHEPLDPEG